MNTVYVICPVATDPDFPLKRAFVKEASYSLGLCAFFPSEERTHFSLAEAINDIVDARFVIADLSVERPSCYYELGLVQALGKQCFIVAERSTLIHQADGRENILFFKGFEEYKLAVNRILELGSLLAVR